MARTPGDSLLLLDRGRPVRFTFADLMRFHGPGSPGGVAHAFTVMERALPLLSADAPPERRGIAIRTAFGGPGARDGFELVTRAVTDGRYVVDAALARPERGVAMERFVFELSHGDEQVTLTVREGFVTEEFIALARWDGRSEEEERELDRLKLEMCRRVMAAAADEVYDAETTGPRG